MTTTEITLLLALEVIGDEWANHYLPQEVLLSDSSCRLLLAVEEMVWRPSSAVTAKTIQQLAPSFYEQFSLAALRPLAKPFGHSREVVGAVMNG